MWQLDRTSRPSGLSHQERLACTPQQAAVPRSSSSSSRRPWRRRPSPPLCVAVACEGGGGGGGAAARPTLYLHHRIHQQQQQQQHLSVQCSTTAAVVPQQQQQQQQTSHRRIVVAAASAVPGRKQQQRRQLVPDQDDDDSAGDDSWYTSGSSSSTSSSSSSTSTSTSTSSGSSSTRGTGAGNSSSSRSRFRRNGAAAARPTNRRAAAAAAAAAAGGGAVRPTSPSRSSPSSPSPSAAAVAAAAPAPAVLVADQQAQPSRSEAKQGENNNAPSTSSNSRSSSSSVGTSHSPDQQQQQQQQQQPDPLSPCAARSDPADSSISSAAAAPPLSCQLPAAQLVQLRSYLDHLLEVNKVMNLTAIRDLEEAWERHIEDSLALLPVIEQYACSSSDSISSSEALSVIDVGTGAGLPGMVLAVVRPHWQVTLLDSLRKRCDFLEGTAAMLGLTNVRVVWCRAEDGARQPDLREGYGVAVARAVAELRVLAELCLPFVQPGGVWVAAKGANPEDEVAAASKALSKLRGKLCAVPRVQSWAPEGQRTAVVVRKQQATPPQYPRPPGTPSKKPL